MKKIDQAILECASKSWREACNHLKVRVVAPYTLEVAEDSTTCLAFLPDFGGQNGMVIGAMDLPKLGTDAHLKKLAERKGFYFSFVNAPAFADAPIDDKAFKDALEDWGYYGTKEKRPAWFKGNGHSTA